MGLLHSPQVSAGGLCRGFLQGVSAGGIHGGSVGGFSK